jgi:hypothetical protein
MRPSREPLGPARELSVPYVETLEPDRRLLGDRVGRDHGSPRATLTLLDDDRRARQVLDPRSSSGDRAGHRHLVIRSVAASLVLVILAVTWVIWFRPQRFGGPALYVEATTTAMAPDINKDDIAIVRKQVIYRVGDVIAYRHPALRAGAAIEVFGRIVYENPALGLVVKADNAPEPDAFHPRSADVVGAVWFRFGRNLLLPLCLVAAAVFVALVAAAWPRSRPRRHLGRAHIEPGRGT